jgi:TatD DNase family protein
MRRSWSEILTVHRNAPAVPEMIEQYLPRDRGTVMLGIKSEAPPALTLGCYFLLKIEMILDRHRALASSCQSIES